MIFKFKKRFEESYQESFSAFCGLFSPKKSNLFRLVFRICSEKCVLEYILNKKRAKINRKLIFAPRFKKAFELYFSPLLNEQFHRL